MSHHLVTINVNGIKRSDTVPARLTLADFLRERLDLTATHLACEHGVCGACTVLVNGETARSCLLFTVQADGAEVTTLEGLSEGSELGPIEQAFWEKHGMQCGFCTPGFVLTIFELLDDNPNPTREEIIEGLGGNLCRCTGYVKIVEAVEEAVTRRGDGT
ncbi:(2Fe-2S)-binding protein [Candidatus Poriferisocius sp.]|uniref:(2Fe-2S)-binding protein n=1 Tax=Candidatus Poriferisocius sp. TaxID=3101276 RepID=UPI003B5965AD